MTLTETIEGVLDIVDVPEAEREQFRQMMLMTATMVAMRTAPAPNDFAVGDTEEEVKKSSEAAAEILENNLEVRAAIADNFTGTLESMRGALSEQKVEEIKKILKEFRMPKGQK